MAFNERGLAVCVVCNGSDFEGVEYPEMLTCASCKNEKTSEEILSYWKTIPFFNAKNNTYYCGCWGWE